MAINIGTQGRLSLEEYATQSPQNSEFTKNLRNKGKEILEQAVDTFFSTGKRSDEVKESIANLKDLEKAVATCIAATMEKAEAHTTEAKAKAVNMNTTMGKLKSEEQTMIKYEGTKAKRVFSKETARCDCGELPSLSGIKGFLKDLHSVIPLYACACMAPGPMAETVKNFARESMTGSMEASSHSSMKADMAGAGLSLLKAAGMTGSARGVSDSHMEGQVSYDKSTTDERIVSTLMDLESRIGMMKNEPATEGEIYAERDVTDYKNVGLIRERYDDVLRPWILKRDYETRSIEKFEVVPQHIWLPDGIV